MNQEELKQRLIELIEQPMPMMSGNVTYGEMRMPEYQARFIADHLIANGVTIRERGEWIDKPTGAYGRMQSWCSNCGKHSGIGGIESNRHKPICPNCGADMRGVKDE